MTIATPFNVATTRAMLSDACRHAGLSAKGAELIRMGENALYRLASDSIMARVGRSADAARKELAVAEWLASHDFPSARLANVPQPIAQGTAVTFWDFIESTPPPGTSKELGVMLSTLHDLPGPQNWQLPPFQPMPKVDARLRQIEGRLPTRDLEFLADRRRVLDAQFQRLDFTLPSGPIHGDAHRDNLLRDRETGRVTLIDFEDFCTGPREWDLCVEAIGYVAFAWISAEDYQRYVEACRFDPLQWSGFNVMRGIRELNMTTWLAQNLGHSPDVDDEVVTRVRDLRNDDMPRKWRPF